MFNSEEGNQCVVTKDDGKVDVLRVSDNGFYYCDAKTATDKATDKDATVLNTVKENKMMYTNAEVSKAELARALQRKLGHISSCKTQGGQGTDSR